MTADILFVIFGSILLLAGFIGCLLPVLPGPPLAWAGFFLASFSSLTDISTKTLIITVILVVLVTIFDTIAPPLFTKKNGGTKYGTWGSTIGLVVGMFLGPIGIILGPFAGSYIGEIINDSTDKKKALKTAWASLVGFLVGSGTKMIVCSILIIILIKSF